MGFEARMWSIPVVVQHFMGGVFEEARVICGGKKVQMVKDGVV